MVSNSCSFIFILLTMKKILFKKKMMETFTHFKQRCANNILQLIILKWFEVKWEYLEISKYHKHNKETKTKTFYSYS